MIIKVPLRHDQCVFLVDCLDYMIHRANERIGNGNYQAWDQFSARRTYDQAMGIRRIIEDVLPPEDE